MRSKEVGRAMLTEADKRIHSEAYKLSSDANLVYQILQQRPGFDPKVNERDRERLEELDVIIRSNTQRVLDLEKVSELSYKQSQTEQEIKGILGGKIDVFASRIWRDSMPTPTVRVVGNGVTLNTEAAQNFWDTYGELVVQRHALAGRLASRPRIK